MKTIWQTGPTDRLRGLQLLVGFWLATVGVAKEPAIGAVAVTAAERAGSPLSEFTAEMVVKYSMAEVVGVLTNAARDSVWLDSCAKSVLLEQRSPAAAVKLHEYELPWYVRAFQKRRFAVVRTATEKGKSVGKLLIRFASVDREVPDHDNWVRTELEGEWRLTVLPGGKLRIWHRIWVDSKFTEKWHARVNKRMKETVVRSFVKLRELLEADSEQLGRVGSPRP